MTKPIETTDAMLGPKIIDYRGLSFVVHPGVFYPGEASHCGSHFFTDVLIEQNPKGSMIDVGCGSGLTGLALTKLTDVERLVATDISTAAIACTLANSVRLDIADQVQTIQSNVFAAVPPMRANVIYWNTPWLYVSRRRRPERQFDPCLYDRGYALLQAYVHDSRSYLHPEGRRFLGSGGGANINLLWTICKENGCEPSLVSEVKDKRALALYELVIPTDRTCVQMPAQGLPLPAQRKM